MNLEQNINYSFKNKKLLKTALTHKSYAYENKKESNERLEFLGDAVLELTITKYLFENCNNLKEGEMTKVRASVVCEKSLLEVAKKHNFGDFLNLGKSELINDGRKRPSLLADSVEAVIGAIYIDGGMLDAEKFIMENLKQSIENSILGMGVKDYKTILQEKLQENGEVQIEYNLLKEVRTRP